ncbi:MAG: TIGR02302 family protein [Rhodospirillaceae bacterium]
MAERGVFLPSGIRYRALLALARSTVYLERLWPVIWPAVAVALLFLGVAFLDVLPLLPQWLHGVVLVAFAGLFAWTLRRAWETRPVVTFEAARHRLQIDSGFEHRPLEALDDQIIVGADDRIGRRLWERHRAKLAERLCAMRLGPPHPDVAGHDRWALRAPLAVVLVIGLAAGAGEFSDRLLRAVTPLGASGLATKDLRIALWITPPAYTGQAPIFIGTGPGDKRHVAAGKDAAKEASKTKPTDKSDGKPKDKKAVAVPETISVPQGSALLAQVTGPEHHPDLIVGGASQPFAAVAGDAPSARSGDDRASYRIDQILDMPGDKDIAITVSGRRVAGWPVKIVADKPPRAEFLSKPGRTGRASLKTDYEATDDYGLTYVTLAIRHPNGKPIPGGEEEIRLILRLAEPGTVLAQGTGVRDLSAHPWAGIEVVGRIEVTDGRGQTGKSDDLKFLLPMRTFNHPVARALIEQRRRLSEAGFDVIDEVGEVLDDLLARPAHFYDDTVVFLALSLVRNRLRHEPGSKQFAEVQKMLWDTALRIEDGDFAVSERDLMDLQNRVMEAMRDGANSEQVEKLIEQLRQALDEYLKALTEQLSRQDLKDIPALDPNTVKAMDGKDLQDLLDKVRELAKNGAMDKARQLLAQLQKALEQIRRGLAMSPQQQQKMAQSNRLMDGLRELTERQRKLLDETFKRAQQNRGFRPNRQGRGDEVQRDPNGARPQGDMAERPGQPRQSQPRQVQPRPGGQPRENPMSRPGERGPGGRRDPDAEGAGQQEALRRALGELMLQMDEMLGNIPEGMGKAERAMRGASRALGEGTPSEATPRQTEALEHLQQSQKQMQQQMAQQFGPMLGLRPGQQGPNQRRGEDPFGRGSGGAFGAAVDGDVDVPSRMEMRRAREILEELRRRAGQQDRPAPERDYIDRLLKQF